MKTLLRLLLASFILTGSALAGATFQKASFSGFIGIGGSDPSEQGGVKVTTTATGGYSIVGKVGNRGFTTKGTFDSNGEVDKDIKIKFLGFTIATIHLTLKLAVDGESIDGTVKVDDTTYPFTVYRAFYSRDNVTTLAGYFTAQLPSPGGNFPGGTGYAGVTISTSGGVRITGKLADGARFSTGGSLSMGDRFPVFNILYKKRGALGGFVDFSNNDTATGSLAWVRLDEATPDVLVPASFSGNVTINVQRYNKPAAGTIALPGVGPTGNIDIDLIGGNLNPDFSTGGTISTTNKVTIPAPNAEKLKVTVFTKTGRVSGTVKLPIGGVTKTLTFRSIIMQTAVNPKAEGYFIGGDKSGIFRLTPD